MAVRVEEEIVLESDKNAPVAGPSIASWEQQKENIQPIKQGRKLESLMEALNLVTDNEGKKATIQAHNEQFNKEMEQLKDDYDKQLDLWVKHIDWLEQHVPDGGKVNGITNAIESCIETYYNMNQFKQDERLFEIFMKFKLFCDEPIEVFGFMYANSICTLLARFYLNWSWQYEIRKNVKRAQDLLKLGLKNLASPKDVLEEATSQLKFRIDRMIRNGQLDECHETAKLHTNETIAKLQSSGIRAALQTLKFHAIDTKGLCAPIMRVGTGSVETVNVGGLKNQTKIVNGIRVAKKKEVRASNKPVEILAEVSEPVPEHANDENAGLSIFKDKIPTSQTIQQVGRRGLENHAPLRGSIKPTIRPQPGGEN